MKIQSPRITPGRPKTLTFNVTFATSDLHLQETPFGLIVNLDGCLPSGTLGGPALPVRVIQIALPLLTRPTSIRCRSLKSQCITEQHVFVAPHQPLPPTPDANGAKLPGVPAEGRRTTRAGEPLPVEPVGGRAYAPPRPELYETEISRPGPLAQLVATQYIGLTPTAVIQLNPVQYNRDGSLQFHSALSVTVVVGSSADEVYPDEHVARDLGSPTDGTLHDTLNRVKTIHSKAQANRLIQLAESVVINPGAVTRYSAAYPDTVGPVEYLVITDDYRWDELQITRRDKAGDLAATFQRLADWKEQLGIKSRVVTITDIVDGVYGDFKTGARDLQEVIRSFLKWVYQEWGVAWVLLGGDTEIVPVRWVGDGYLERDEWTIKPQTNDPPERGRSHWAGSFLKMNLRDLDWWGWPGSRSLYLVRPDDGTLIPFDALGASGPDAPGWYFVEDDAYATRSNQNTGFVRVEGPEGLLNTGLQWLFEYNMIPTDFYYASLVGPDYSRPGQHDWDVLGNGRFGVYGQHDADPEHDGISYHADVGVGRAPVRSADEANTFVDKTITYEKFRRPDETLLDVFWPCHMLFVSTDWFSLWFDQAVAAPPAVGSYYHEVGTQATLLHLDVKNLPAVAWKLSAQVGHANVRGLPYNSAATRGWYFAISDTDLSPSEFTVHFNGSENVSPLPTPWIVVHSDAPEELEPAWYVIDEAGPDGSMTDTELLRRQLKVDFPEIAAITRLYMDDADLPAADAVAAPLAHATGEGVRSALDGGPHIVCLSGHGTAWWGCCYLDTPMADDLVNGIPGFIAYADSCLTNQFDADSMGEHLLRNPRGGAVAYIGNTRFGWGGGLGAAYEAAIFHHLASAHRLGSALDARCALRYRTSSRCDNKWMILTINLLGDPHLWVWTGMVMAVGGSVEIEHDEVKYHSEDGDAGGGEGWGGPHVHGKIKQLKHTDTVDSSGDMTYGLPPGVAGDVEVTVSRPGYAPLIVTRHLARPGWVSGRVTGVVLGDDALQGTRVTLYLEPRSGETATSTWQIRAEERDYGLLVNAVLSAYATQSKIGLYVEDISAESPVHGFRLMETRSDGILTS